MPQQVLAPLPAAVQSRHPVAARRTAKARRYCLVPRHAECGQARQSGGSNPCAGRRVAAARSALAVASEAARSSEWWRTLSTSTALVWQQQQRAFWRRTWRRGRTWQPRSPWLRTCWLRTCWLRMCWRDRTCWRGGENGKLWRRQASTRWADGLQREIAVAARAQPAAALQPM